MIEAAFNPWVGIKYGSPDNLFARRVLVLGESHYGSEGTEYADTTIDVVSHFTKGGARHAFFTKIAKVLLGFGKNDWLSQDQLAEAFENVAFYNFVPWFVGDWARQRPTPEMWEAGKEPFLRVVDALRPDLVIILGFALNHNVPELPKGIKRCNIQHPSTGFSYEEWGPVVATALR